MERKKAILEFIRTISPVEKLRKTLQKSNQEIASLPEEDTEEEAPFIEEERESGAYFNVQV